MRKILNSLVNNKSVAAISILMILFFLLATCFSFTGMSSSAGSVIHPLNQWVIQHKLVFIFWHILILLAMYFGFEMKIKQESTRRNLSLKSIKKMRYLGWCLIGALIVMDLFVFF